MSCCCCFCGGCDCSGFACGGNCCCGRNSCGTSMSTVNPSASVNQALCCCQGDGGASSLSTALGAISKFGSLITGASTAKTNATAQVAIATQQSKTIMYIVIFAIIAVLVYLGTRK